MRAPILAATLGAALAAAALASASGPAHGAAAPARTLIVTWKRSDYGPVVFVPSSKGRGDSFNRIRPGDVILSTNVLRNAAGAPIGKVYQHLTFITASSNFMSADFEQSVYVFSDGQIAATAVNVPGTSSAEAITGGSGAYAGARGTISDVSAAGSTTSREAIRLLG